MKTNTTTLTTVLSLMLAMAAPAAMAQAPRAEFAPVDHLFVPHGFDNNDTAEVVTTGYLPTPCYERPESKVRVAGNSVQVRVTTHKTPNTLERQGLCADVVVPFTEAIRVGHLPAGDYRVAVNAGSNTAQNGAMRVAMSTIGSVDEHHYAIVQYVEQASDQKFYVNGYVYSDCFQMDSLRYVSNNKDAISVLPIMKQVRDHCPRKMTPFRYQMNPPLNTLKSPYFLLHVRSADGKSVNFVASKK